jgi:hypothetical protein
MATKEITNATMVSKAKMVCKIIVAIELSKLLVETV